MMKPLSQRNGADDPMAKPAINKVDSALVGAAGEHLVLSRLLSQGFLASPAPRGTRKADILVNFLDGGEPFLVQVKSRSPGPYRGWHMGEKHEKIIDPDMFYCFVDFQSQHPEVFVMPARFVAEVIERDHRLWMGMPGKKGQPHNATPFRRMRPGCFGMPEGWMDEYLEAWHLLTPGGPHQP